MTPRSRGKAPRGGPRCSRTCAAPRGRGSASPRRGPRKRGGRESPKRKEGKQVGAGRSSGSDPLPPPAPRRPGSPSRAPLPCPVIRPPREALAETARERKGREGRGERETHFCKRQQASTYGGGHTLPLTCRSAPLKKTVPRPLSPPAPPPLRPRGGPDSAAPAPARPLLASAAGLVFAALPPRAAPLLQPRALSRPS